MYRPQANSLHTQLFIICVPFFSHISIVGVNQVAGTHTLVNDIAICSISLYLYLLKGVSLNLNKLKLNLVLLHVVIHP